MRVFVLYAHPVETSFGAALHAASVAALREVGHEVDDCDLYAEEFNPVMSRQERINYHELEVCTKPVQTYVDRVRAAQAIVLVYPVWNFGFPAILKGFFDRVFLPGVSFRLENGLVWPNLHNIRKLAAVTTYGGHRWRALVMGDPPRKSVKRVLRAVIHPLASSHYLALYDLNRASDATRANFLERVRHAMRTF
jgi:putative NADPH-quinone reductase